MRTRLKRTVNRARGRFGPHAVVLLYHRIATCAEDVYNLCVSPTHFEEHLQVIRSVGTPMALDELVQRSRENRLPHRAICVTFDDGYVDNYRTARPLLERYDIPATIFMTTGRGGREREFWWDELERIFLGSGSLPPRLELEIGGKSVKLDLTLREAAHSPAAGWSLFDPDPPTPRHRAMQQVYLHMQTISVEEQTRLLDALLVWSGKEAAVRPTHRVMNADEVVRLSEGGAITVGAHTENHASLPGRPIDDQRTEIRRSKACLEEWVGQPIRSFAYPYGHASEETAAEVRRAGFAYACACGGRPVRRDSENYLLPRVDAPDVNGDSFARQLRSFFRG